MASLMLAGGKLGAIRGADRAFVAGCVVFGLGSLVVEVSAGVGAAQVNSMKAALTWTAGVVVGALVATFLPGRGKRDRPEAPGPKPALK